MLGSLCLKYGVLYVGRHVLTAHVRPYDLDGRALGAGFSFRASDGGRAEATGIAVDEDRRLWVADRACGRVRAFTLFGLEVGGLETGTPPDVDRPGGLGGVVDVAADGTEEESRLIVSRGGRRRHALQLFEPRGGSVLSLRPRGDPEGTFAGLAGIALCGRRVWACEAGAGTVQVFRDLEFLFSFTLASNPGFGARFEPRAVAPLSDGRSIVVQGGPLSSALLLFDASGRLERILAEHGAEVGSVLEPWDVAVEEGADDRGTRTAVIDRDGDRVQVFSLDGRCLGEFPDLSPEPFDVASRDRIARSGGAGQTRREGDPS